MNRRGFLQSLMIGASALAVDPERLLWKPNAKTIFIPNEAPAFESIRFTVEDIARVYNVPFWKLITPEEAAAYGISPKTDWRWYVTEYSLNFETH